MSKIEVPGLHLLTGVVAFSISLSLAGCGFLAELPTDAHLKLVFTTHQQELTELVSMLDQDNHMLAITYNFFIVYGYPPSYKGNSQFTNARWVKYLVLMQKIGCDSINRRNPNGSIYFVMGSNGSAISGETNKGIVYSPVNLSPIAKSLDGDLVLDNAEKTGQTAEAYVDLGQSWYIFEYAY